VILTTTQFSGGGRTRRGSGGAADRRRHRVLGLQWRQLGFRGIKAARVRGGSKGGRGVLYRGGRGCLGVRAKKERAARRRAAAGLCKVRAGPGVGDDRRAPTVGGLREGSEIRWRAGPGEGVLGRGRETGRTKLLGRKRCFLFIFFCKRTRQIQFEFKLNEFKFKLNNKQ